MSEELALRLAEQGDCPEPLFPLDVATDDPSQVSLFSFPLSSKEDAR